MLLSAFRPAFLVIMMDTAISPAIMTEGLELDIRDITGHFQGSEFLITITAHPITTIITMLPAIE